MRLKTATRTLTHGILARPGHDELAREKFVLSLKGGIRHGLGKAPRAAFEHHALPAFQKEHGAAPASLEDLRAPMAREPLYQMWSALSRSAQNMMWDAVGASIEREAPRMENLARKLRRSNRKLGSLMLNPSVEMPEYIGHIDIHGQPGGYEQDESPDDIVPGALYESGGNLYSRGVAIGRYDSKAGCLIGYLREHHANLGPTRILDLGCSAGGASVPYAEAFPEAEVQAIDIGAGMLRYAHARAESLGFPVHFSQRNAEDTGFSDGGFDLIVSHNLFHELSRAGGRRILKECHRLLRPGGAMFHLDIPAQRHRFDLLDQFVGDWQTWYNSEPCWPAYVTMDAGAELEAAGFDRAAIEVLDRPKVDGPGNWFIFGAVKA